MVREKRDRGVLERTHEGANSGVPLTPEQVVVVEPEDYDGLTVTELRDILKVRGLKVSGNRAALIVRLTTSEE